MSFDSSRKHSNASGKDIPLEEQILEEGSEEVFEEVVQVEVVQPQSTRKYDCSLIHPSSPPPTLTEYKIKSIRKKPLFKKVLEQKKSEPVVEKLVDENSCEMLVTGFGLRNLASLQRCLDKEERKRLILLYKQQQAEEGEGTITTTSSQTSHRIELTPKRSVETETELASITSDVEDQKIQLVYLMGLQPADEEEYLEPVLEEEKVEEKDIFQYSTSVSMRNAQKYLRVHRIFDFFQFIITHLLSALPQDPIDFILELLNRCLIYRSGRGSPPLLFEKKHINELFNLMDRMRTGMIELDQYHKGMTTLMICEYEKNPTLNDEEMVDKETFVDEAYDAEIALFDDLIKRKYIGKKPKKVNLSITSSNTVSKDMSPYFIPSELFKTKHPEVEASEGHATDTHVTDHHYSCSDILL